MLRRGASRGLYVYCWCGLLLIIAQSAWWRMAAGVTCRPSFCFECVRMCVNVLASTPTFQGCLFNADREPQAAYNVAAHRLPKHGGSPPQKRTHVLQMVQRKMDCGVHITDVERF